MKIEGPLMPATFESRPNRFMTKVNLNGIVVDSHLPDPGRLKELLFPGASVLVRPVPEDSPRKTRFSTVMVYQGNTLISLVSALPNKFVKEGLLKNEFPFLNSLSLVKAEIPYGKHRFDFLLNDKENSPFYLEVKSVTFVENGVGKFPDAVTARGTAHVNTLAGICRNGGKAGILFVCQRPDVTHFEPMYDRDPVFADALWEASKAGVNVWCITTDITEKDMTFKREIPVYLKPL